MAAMRLLVIGGGGREHALAWKLRQSPAVKDLFVAPGNAGIARLASCVPVDQSMVVELADFAASVRVDLTVVGPELPLTLGLVDRLQERGLRAFGPSRLAAELEGSKVFSKRFMERHGIPTAAFRVVSSRQEAEHVLDAGELGWPVVVKADGLAAGKGVVIAATRAEAQHAVVQMFDARAFGSAGDQVVLEECLRGAEVSFHVLSDGEVFYPLASAQDYKRLRDGNEGPNTGGMGTVSPSPVLSKDVQAHVLQHVVKPTLDGMRAEGRPYVGVLYVGLMLTPEGPKVLEYNCRLGDPETQVLLTRLDGDLVAVLEATLAGKLHEVHPRWAHHASVCVVMAAKGYPGKVETGAPIDGLDDASALDGVTIFHASTRLDGSRVVTSGGRVLGITAVSPSLAAAREQAYAAVGRIRFDGAQHRADIALDVLRHLQEKRPA